MSSVGASVEASVGTSVERKARGDALVVMPARNEAARIGPLLRELRERLPDADLLVIDDDSSDDTARVARLAGAGVSRLPIHLGYGGALQTGYKFALERGHRFVLQMDSDGQHRPADAADLLARIRREDADLVIGSRFAPRRAAAGAGAVTEPQPEPYQMDAFRSFGRDVLNACARLGGLHVTDPTSGFQALNRRALRLFASDWYPIDYPDVDVLLLAHRRGLRIVEQPVEMQASPRPSTLHSGWMPIYYAYRMLLSLWALGAVPRLGPEDDERNATADPGHGPVGEREEAD